MADELIPMSKDGETIAVHPSCVADHQSLGWVVAVAAETPAAETPAEEPVAKKKK